MTDRVTIARTFRPDPLGRDEPDLLERLHAMADDALAKKDEAAVEQEAEVVRSLLGLAHRRKPTDPAIGAFLTLMEADITAGRVETMPEDLVASLRQALAGVDVDLDAPIKGGVCLTWTGVGQE